MDFLKDVLIEVLSKQKINITFPDFEKSIKDIVLDECYRTLHYIKHIIEDDKYSDEECFKKIEEIVCAMETLGPGGGGRHDFG